MWDQLNTRNVVIFDVIKGAEFSTVTGVSAEKKNKKKRA